MAIKWQETYAESEVEILGSPSPQQSEWVRRAVLDLMKNAGTTRHPNHVIANAVIVFQAIHARNNEGARGIGGAFFGIRASEGGVARHCDIAYLVLNPSTRSPEIDVSRCVLTGWRDHLAFSMEIARNGAGNFGRRIRMLAANVNPVTPKEAAARVPELMGDLDPRYIALIDPETGTSVTLEQNDYVARTFGRMSLRDRELTFIYSRRLLGLLKASIDEARRIPIVLNHFVSEQADMDSLVSRHWLSPVFVAV